MVYEMRINIIAPVFNEEGSISYFIDEVFRIIEILERSNKGHILRLTLVDDGSHDRTLSVTESHPYFNRIQLIKLSRNFGHQNAVWAGLESTKECEFAIVLDSDLQDPPAMLINIAEAFQENYDVVLMQRVSRQEKFLKRKTASMFYYLQSKLGSKNQIRNVGDFFGLSPRALAALLSHKERVKYIRGLVSEIGFNRVLIPYERLARTRGITHYTIPKMFSLALAMLTGFSVQPLILIVCLALAGALLGISLVFYIIYIKLQNQAEFAPGWAFATIISTGLSSLTLIALAIISIYLARIMQELKNRPSYIIESVAADTEL
jgi:dolichol-phosphate mannosyltransferase